MSIIGTIRTKFIWLLLVLIALAILAFLLMDSTNGRGSALSGRDFSIGSVNGKNVKYSDLQAEMNQVKRLYPNAKEEQISNTAWNNIVDNKLFNEKYEALGIHVSNEEIANKIFSDNPHPIARQYFGSLFADGKYDAAQVRSFVEENENKDVMMQQITSILKKSIREEKYAAMLKNGVNVPTWIAEDAFLKEQKTVDFSYLMLPYTLVKDSEISFTDSDLLAFAKENPRRFISKGGTVLEYVRFPKKASKADSLAAKNELGLLKADFASSSDAKTFAQTNSNATLRGINPTVQYHTSSSLNLPETQKTQILSAKVGDIVGPFTAGGVLGMVKVLDKSTVADSAKVRHILVKDKDLADSLATVLKANKSKFGSFVKEYSTDTPSVAKEGVYDFFPQGRMVPEFNAAAFNNKIGSIEVVPTQFGFHIVEPLARKGKSNGVELATIAKSVKASEATYDAAYNKAKAFAKENNTTEKFQAAAKEIGGMQTTPEIEPNASTVPGIGQNYDLIKWLNKASVGSVKNFDTTNDFVVARVVSRVKKGDVNLEKNRVTLEAEVKKQKKAEVLAKQVAEKGGAATAISTLAGKFNRNVENAKDAKFGGNGTGIGYEPNVMAKAFLSGKGQVNETISGNRGVYIIDVKNLGSVESNGDIESFKAKAMNSMNSAATVGGLKSKYSTNGVIKDERYKARR